MPSIVICRTQAKKSVCTAHMKNIAPSGQVYASDDPNEMVIPVHPLMVQQDPNNPDFIGTYEWGGKSGIGETGWVPTAGGKYFNHYRTELVSSDDSDRQERNKCIVVRGPGWQEDTLPAGQIATGLQWNQTGRVSSAGCAGSISDD